MNKEDRHQISSLVQFWQETLKMSFPSNPAEYPVLKACLLIPGCSGLYATGHITHICNSSSKIKPQFWLEGFMVLSSIAFQIVRRSHFQRADI